MRRAPRWRAPGRARWARCWSPARRASARRRPSTPRPPRVAGTGAPPPPGPGGPRAGPTGPDALAAEARGNGGATLRGRGEPESGPYGVWRPIVRALSPGRGASADGDLRRLLGAAAEAPGAGGEAQLRLFDAVADVIETAAARRPLLVLLDDLHWVDASSLRLLAHVAGAATAARVLIVGTARAGDAPPVLSEAERVELSGLSLEGVRRLLPAEAGAAGGPAGPPRPPGDPCAG